MKKTTVAFICTHNSCRSQMAEAISKALAADIFDSCSAGTSPKPRIDRDAVRLINARYGIDMDKTQRPKSTVELPAADIVITMGCGVECPYIPASRREDWGLEDPTGRGDDVFAAVIGVIEEKVRLLADSIRKEVEF